jgi:glucokinase-like ROK family protein
MVVDVLRRRGSASQADIARETGLSRTSVSNLVAELREAGLVVERDEPPVAQSGRAGRRGVPLALDPAAGIALGVDFGHTHMRVAASDLSSRVLAERNTRLDVDRSAAEALDTAAELVTEILAAIPADRGDVLGVGLGLPGPIDQTSGLVGSSVILPGWRGINPKAELERRLDLRVEVDNDVNLGALGELTFGAGKGAKDFIYVKVASGVGAGLVLGGRLYRGASGMAGEIGHVLVDLDGEVCRCGNRGCLETIASTPALLALLRRSHGRDLGLTEDLSVTEMLAAACDGDPRSRRVLTDGGRAIGRVLADLCNSLNPKLIVVGGELSAAGEPLVAGIRDSIDRNALPAVAGAVSVRNGVLAESAELLGALALVVADTERLSSGRLTAISS